MKEFSSILKRTDSSAFRSRVCLFFYEKSCKLLYQRLCVVKDWIIVISSKIGYQLLSCLSSEEIIIHLTENFLSDIVRYKLNVKATHNFSSGPVWKKKKRKEDKM